MKKIYRLLLVLSILFSWQGYTLSGQTYEEYRKKEIENFNKYVEQESAIISKMAAEINSYIKKEDKEYREYLKKEWQQYNQYAAAVAPKKPKPAAMPEYGEPGSPERVKAASIAPSKQVLSVYGYDFPTISMPLTMVSLPPGRGGRAAESSGEQGALRVNYYGVPLYFSYNPNFVVRLYGVNNEGGVANYWDRASSGGYSSLVEQLTNYKLQLNLNDFCYYLLVKKVAQGLYAGDETGETLATWFLMVRSGYGARVGFDSGGRVLLMLPSYHTIYGMNYLQEGSKYLYIMGKTPGRGIRTYDRDFAGAGKVVDFNIYSPMNLGGKIADKTLEFEYNNKRYSILVNYDRGLVELYRDYPQVEMPVYFNAAVSMQAKESIAASLQPILSEMSEQEAVEFLLSFTQSSFPYKTDDLQFGYEKFFFAEEMFFYPYSDCEDRSVFFAYIVKELLGLNVIGVEFSDHVATAVMFNTHVAGDHINFNNMRYVIADPTYLGAPVGSAMPQYRESSPLVIEVENRRGAGRREDQIWSSAIGEGCFPGSNLRNLVTLSDESYVVTGYYTGNAKFGGKPLPPAGTINRGFIGRATQGHSAVWVLPMITEGNSVGVSVATGLNDDIYVAGSFRGNLTLGSSTLSNGTGSTEGGNADAFVACINKNGVVRWITRLNLDTIPGSAPIAFSAVFSANGVKMAMTKTIASAEFKGYGLFTGNDGKVVFNGIVNRVFSSAPAVASASYASAAASPEMLKKETDAMLAESTDKGIAGLFAAILLVKNMGATLSGEDAKAALDKYNPGFSKNCPNIYKNLSMINFVKNSNGVISIQTVNGKDIYFDKIRVKNNANINIVQHSQGDLSVEVLSGIQVGKMVVWYKLNSIALQKKTGDMVFDYDKDNSTAKVNMSKDILL